MVNDFIIEKNIIISMGKKDFDKTAQILEDSITWNGDKEFVIEWEDDLKKLVEENILSEDTYNDIADEYDVMSYIVILDKGQK